MNGGILLTISDPGFRNQRTVEVASLSASWEVSAIGRLSATIPADVAHRLGFTYLVDKWVHWDGGRCGLWGGVIRRTPTETRNGTMELSCDTFHVLFQGIATQRSYRQASAPAGALWVRAVSDAATDRRLWVDSYAADEDGPLVALEWRGDDLYDVSDWLATNTGHEWDVTLDTNLKISAEFRKRVGRTKRVILADGYNVTAGQVAPSVDPVVNEIIAIPEEQQWERTARSVVVDASSVTRFGRVQETRRYAGLSGPESLFTRARLDLERDAELAIPATVIVPATDPVNGSIRQGDSVRYWSARQNRQYEMRITSRSIDVAEGQVTYAGDCMEIG